MADPLVQWSYALRHTTTRLAVNDIITDSYGSAYLNGHTVEDEAWWAVSEDTMAARYNPGGLAGRFIQAFEDNPNPYTDGSHWDTYQGSAINTANAGSAVVARGFGADAIQLADGQQMEIARSMDGFELALTRQPSGGNAQVRVDSVLVDTVATAGALNSGNRSSYDLGTLASHTVRVTASGGPVIVDAGRRCRGNRLVGVAYERGGTGGFTMTSLLTSVGDPYWQHIENRDPDLITFQLGFNDAGTDTGNGQQALSVTDYIAAAKACWARARSLCGASICHVFQPHVPAYTPANYVTAYLPALQDACAQNDVKLCNWQDTLGTYNAASNNWAPTDGLHPEAASHLLMGTAYTAAITPTNPSGVLLASSGQALMATSSQALLT